MNLLRTVLLLDWREERQWKRARKRLKQAVKKAHKKVEKKVEKAERRGPREGESSTDFAQRLLKKQEKIRKKVFDRRQERLNRLQAKETKRFDQYVKADRKRRVKKQLKAIPKLGPRPAGPPKIQIPGLNRPTGT